MVWHKYRLTWYILHAPIGGVNADTASGARADSISNAVADKCGGGARDSDAASNCGVDNEEAC